MAPRALDSLQYLQGKRTLRLGHFYDWTFFLTFLTNENAGFRLHLDF